MSPKSIIEAAFSPDGPLFDTPRSMGRRPQDKTIYWVRIVKEVGFPIVAAWWLAYRLLPAIETLTKKVDRDTRVTAALICKVDPADCVKNLETP